MPASRELAIEIPHAAIADFCRRWNVREFAFFGSVVRDDFRAESDVDVLIEFKPGYSPGWKIVDMQDELSALFGRRVDLRTREELSRWMIRGVLEEAVVEYVEAE